MDWDPDIVAALDDDFDFEDPENQLEDDFIVAAMEGEVSYHEEEQVEGMAPKMNRFELCHYRKCIVLCIAQSYVLRIDWNPLI